MVKITFYVKGGCWLCDAAEEMLNGIRGRYGLAINKVDIESDDELHGLHRFDVPVVEFADGTALHGRIRKKDLVRCIREHQE